MTNREVSKRFTAASKVLPFTGSYLASTFCWYLQSWPEQMASKTNPHRVLVTGAAGLVGQNLIPALLQNTDLELVAIDKHVSNTATLKRLHPSLHVIEADLSRPGEWERRLGEIGTVIVLHAQIGGTDPSEFETNNVEATRRVVDAARHAGVDYVIHVSSSVVNSQADDLYTRSKKQQEALIAECGIAHVILRPTLMFGWFDRKHLGWLRRFMGKSPVFPVPGNGNFLRQPLYAGDFSSIVQSCLTSRTEGSFNISGLESVFYIDIIRSIRQLTGARTRIVMLPYQLFHILLRLYALIDRNPPFTTDQLEALIVPELFETIDWPAQFGVAATPLHDALQKTFLDPDYADVALEF